MTHYPIECDICKKTIAYIKQGGTIQSIVCPKCYEAAYVIAGQLKDMVNK